MAILIGELRYERLGTVTLPAMSSRCHVAVCLAELGSFTEGSVVAEEAVRISEEAEQPYSIAAALIFVGLLSRRQGDIHRAISALERSLALCQTAHFPRIFPMAASLLGGTYALAGRAMEGLPLLDQTLERVAAGSHVIYHALVLTELSEALLLVGRMEEASALARRLLELSRTHTGSGYQAHALRLLGETAARGNPPPDAEQAETYYCQALALAEELGMRPLQAHCRFGLGTLYNQMGQAQQARTALGTAIELYRTMEMTFWLPQAEAALAQVA
jgi:tetratricopeptide (TPR) repeat protein